MKIGNRTFDVRHHTYIMGILNATPDSFSDGGLYTDTDAALFRAEQILKDGADIIDVGGESTRPGYAMISEEEEIERTAPLIERLRRAFDPVISIDTYKAGVAYAAFAAGADLVNDIWGFRYEACHAPEEAAPLQEEDGDAHGAADTVTEIARLTAQCKKACCLSHNRTDAVYPEGLIPGVLADLQESVRIAQTAGVPRSQILLDPGIGFAKTYEMNLAVLRQIDALKALDLPVLLGTSRKSVIGQALSLPVSERVEGTLATTVYAVLHGCAFVRVHDVKENRRAIRMTEAIIQAGKEAVKGGSYEDNR